MKIAILFVPLSQPENPEPEKKKPGGVVLCR
jgi:hypothetical protein